MTASSISSKFIMRMSFVMFYRFLFDESIGVLTLFHLLFFLTLNPQPMLTNGLQILEQQPLPGQPHTKTTSGASAVEQELLSSSRPHESSHGSLRTVPNGAASMTMSRRNGNLRGSKTHYVASHDGHCADGEYFDRNSPTGCVRAHEAGGSSANADADSMVSNYVDDIATAAAESFLELPRAATTLDDDSVSELSASSSPPTTAEDFKKDKDLFSRSGGSGKKPKKFVDIVKNLAQKASSKKEKKEKHHKHDEDQDVERGDVENQSKAKKTAKAKGKAKSKSRALDPTQDTEVRVRVKSKPAGEIFFKFGKPPPTPGRGVTYAAHRAPPMTADGQPGPVTDVRMQAFKVGDTKPDPPRPKAILFGPLPGSSPSSLSSRGPVTSTGGAMPMPMSTAGGGNAAPPVVQQQQEDHGGAAAPPVEEEQPGAHEPEVPAAARSLASGAEPLPPAAAPPPPSQAPSISLPPPPAGYYGSGAPSSAAETSGVGKDSTLLKTKSAAATTTENLHEDQDAATNTGSSGRSTASVATETKESHRHQDQPDNTMLKQADTTSEHQNVVANPHESLLQLSVPPLEVVYERVKKMNNRGGAGVSLSLAAAAEKDSRESEQHAAQGPRRDQDQERQQEGQTETSGTREEAPSTSSRSPSSSSSSTVLEMNNVANKKTSTDVLSTLHPGRGSSSSVLEILAQKRAAKERNGNAASRTADHFDFTKDLEPTSPAPGQHERKLQENGAASRKVESDSTTSTRDGSKEHGSTSNNNKALSAAATTSVLNDVKNSFLELQRPAHSHKAHRHRHVDDNYYSDERSGSSYSDDYSYDHHDRHRRGGGVPHHYSSTSSSSHRGGHSHGRGRGRSSRRSRNRPGRRGSSSGRSSTGAFSDNAFSSSFLQDYGNPKPIEKEGADMMNSGQGKSAGETTNPSSFLADSSAPPSSLASSTSPTSISSTLQTSESEVQNQKQQAGETHQTGKQETTSEHEVARRLETEEAKEQEKTGREQQQLSNSKLHPPQAREDMGTHARATNGFLMMERQARNFASKDPTCKQDWWVDPETGDKWPLHKVNKHEPPEVDRARKEWEDRCDPILEEEKERDDFEATRQKKLREDYMEKNAGFHKYIGGVAPCEAAMIAIAGFALCLFCCMCCLSKDKHVMSDLERNRYKMLCWWTRFKIFSSGEEARSSDAEVSYLYLYDMFRSWLVVMHIRKKTCPLP
ncbi:unnamed protein product [Amoebophrya sp. A120]|nr:unnamed protein product [Amoebophrya sp. A120]|eukprot:GSA120T00007816001.1